MMMMMMMLMMMMFITGCIIMHSIYGPTKNK